MRLFAASFLPADTAEKIYEVSKSAACCLGAEAVTPEKMHVTYKYFGEKEPEECLELAEKAAAGFKAHLVKAKGVRFFSYGGYASVLWAAIKDESGVLGKTAAAMGGAEKDFTAHVTMARFKKGAAENASVEKYIGNNSLAEKEFGFFTIKSVCLVESVSAPGGTKYKTVKEFYPGKENG